jgi:hypothetical protein
MNLNEICIIQMAYVTIDFDSWVGNSPEQILRSICDRKDLDKVTELTINYSNYNFVQSYRFLEKFKSVERVVIHGEFIFTEAFNHVINKMIPHLRKLKNITNFEIDVCMINDISLLKYISKTKSIHTVRICNYGSPFGEKKLSKLNDNISYFKNKVVDIFRTPYIETLKHGSISYRNGRIQYYWCKLPLLMTGVITSQIINNRKHKIENNTIHKCIVDYIFNKYL